MVKKDKISFRGLISFLNRYSLYLFFFLFVLLYLQLPLVEFFFLVPLYWHLKTSKKINYLLIWSLVFVVTFIIFLPFVNYGIKYFFILLISLLIFFTIFVFIGKNLINKKYKEISLAGLFFILFYFLNFTPIGNYWLNIAGFLSSFPITIRYLGSYGILILILILNYLFYEIFNTYLKNKKQKTFSIILIFVLLVHFFVLPIFNLNSYENNSKISIAAIQGDLNQNWGDRIKNKEKNYEKYINLSNKALLENPTLKVIVWPEYTFTHEIELDYLFVNKLISYSYKKNITLIFGSFLLENKSSISSKRYDTLYIFNNGKFYFYNAYKPISIFDTNTINANNNMPVEIENTNFGFAICYEENFQDIFSKQIKNFNSQFFIIASNQFLIKSKFALELSSLNSNLRAAEFNRYILRTANTGLTKLIDNRGKTIKSVPINSEQILYYEIPLIDNVTSYAQHKTFIDFFYIVLFLLFLFLDLGFSKHNKS